MRVFIYCGVPGSGKSTRVATEHPDAFVFSADDYFTGSDGVYRFDPAKLGEAHGSCLRRFTTLVRARSIVEATTGRGDLVVDNTNTSVAEVAPYAALALAHGWELHIVTLLIDPVIAAARNVHEVPAEAVNRMDAELRARALPPWWPHEVVEVIP